MPKSMFRALAVSGALAGGLLLSACATKEYVDEQVGGVQSQVTGLKAQVDDHSGHLSRLDGETAGAMARANSAYALAQGKFVYTEVARDNSTLFATGRSNLTAPAKAHLAELANKLKGDNANVFVEIQGHADSVGNPTKNLALGWARAHAVQQFLNEQGVALNRMSTISYGEEAPVTPAQRRGEAANRRVTILIVR